MTTESEVVSISILKEIPFDGKGDTLFNRLRRVSLRGFPEVKIYENAQFEPVFKNKNQIAEDLHTPQLRVYRDNLTRISKLHELFKKQGIDILDLNKAYDYTALHESGEITEWTMLPPIVERWEIPTKQNKLDYKSIIAQGLSTFLDEQGAEFNPELNKLKFNNTLERFDLINDGSHRIHYGFENGGIKALLITEINKGYPYYAAPQRYNVKVFETREEALKSQETKIHIVKDPHHKSLYRLFPSGGIKSGDIRSH